MIAFVSAFAFALVLGPFVEYWGHRLMHAGWFLRGRHAHHHARNGGQGVLGEFLDYFAPTLVLIGAAFLISRPVGFGFAIGDIAYAAFAAYAHQIQHERPDLCIWMARPVHRMHHDHRMWHHNFGVAFDFWDRVFGTFRPVGAPTARTDRPWSAWFAIHWASPSPPANPIPPARRSAPVETS